jgi:hypothetical protein
MRLPDLNDLIQDLQLAKQIAIDNQNANALTIATMSQAKLLGIDKPLKDVTPNSNIKSGLGHFYGRIPDLTPEIALAISKRLDEEY